MSKSIFEKRFLTAAQAQAAIDKAELVSVQIIKDGKMHIVVPAEVEAPAAVAIGARQEQEAAIKELQGDIKLVNTEAQCAALLDRLNEMAAKFDLTEAVVASLDEAIGARAMEIEGEQALTQAQVANAPGNKPGWVHASSVLKPTKMVWAIADAMYADAEAKGEPMPTRKQVQDECVKLGIASGTARTQFQHWFKQRNESANAPRAQIVDGKIIPAKA